MANTVTHSNLQLDVSNRQILKLALPISLAMLVPQFNFITNNIFLGHLNEQSLATASITGVYYLIFAAIGYGLNNGLQALISRRAGENRPEEIGKLFNQGIIISTGIAAIGILLTYFIAPFILQYAIHSDITYKQAVSFLRIRIWGLPFLYVYQMRNALLVGTNQSRYLVLGTLAEALSNIFFDYSLIFGKMGFPKWGFNGAAVASIIAEFSGMFVVFLVIHWKGISNRFALFKNFKWDGANNKLILSMSAPLIFQHAISITSWTFFYLLIEHHGERDLAISNTMRNIFGFFGIFTWAFAATSNAMVSNIIGQGKQDKVVLLIRKIVRISLTFSLSVCVLLNLFPGIFLSIYGQDQDFISHAIPVMRIVSGAMILMSFGTVWLNAVTGTGKSKITFLIEAITIVIYCVYIYLVLEKFKLNITIGWMSEWLYWIGMFSLSYWYIMSGKWKSTKI